MPPIAPNCLVSISLTLLSESKEVLDESDEIIYLHRGYGQLLPKLEEALEGKKVGDRFEVTLSSNDAFGPYNPALAVQEPLEELPDDILLGMELDGDDGHIWVVEEIRSDTAILNANHPLAGLPLIAIGEILEVEQLDTQGVEEILALDENHHH